MTARDEALGLARRGHFRDAERVLVAAIARRGAGSAEWSLLAGVLMNLGEHERALYFAQRCIDHEPASGHHHAVLGDAYRFAHRTDAAAHAYERAIALDGTLIAPRVSLAGIRTSEHRLDEARDLLEQSFAMNPGAYEVIQNLAGVKLELGSAGEAAAGVHRHLDTHPDDVRAWGLLAFLGQYMEDADVEEVARWHRRAGSLLEGAIPRIPRARALPTTRLRVGILSADLRTHPAARFLLPILRHTDAARVDWIAYHLSRDHDETTAEFRGLVREWRDVASVRDAELAQMITRDGIHILLDLAGRTRGERLGVLARAPAPVQVTYLGYPGTTGLVRVDARLVDAITDPEGSEGLCSERLVRLAPCFVCYAPARDTPDVEMSGNEDSITFGSFNVLAKTNDRAIGVWARILNAVPGSRMVLKTGALANGGARERICAIFERDGVTRDRVQFLTHTTSHREHLATYRRISIGLDTMPYNGATTTCEALWMGVPVVTCRGRSHAGRVGASILNAAGLGDLVGESEDAMVEIAAGLARDPARLADLRSTLRTKMECSVLCDGRGFACRFVDVLHGIWREACVRGAHAE